MISYFFHWYSGAIWANLLATIITTVVAIVWGRRKFIKWHREQERRHEERHTLLRSHIDEHMKKLYKKLDNKEISHVNVKRSN